MILCTTNSHVECPNSSRYMCFSRFSASPWCYIYWRFEYSTVHLCIQFIIRVLKVEGDVTVHRAHWIQKRGVEIIILTYLYLVPGTTARYLSFRLRSGGEKPFTSKKRWFKTHQHFSLFSALWKVCSTVRMLESPPHFLHTSNFKFCHLVIAQPIPAVKTNAYFRIPSRWTPHRHQRLPILLEGCWGGAERCTSTQT